MWTTYVGKPWSGEVVAVYNNCGLCGERWVEKKDEPAHRCKRTPEQERKYAEYMREQRIAAEQAARATSTCSNCGTTRPLGVSHDCPGRVTPALPTPVDQLAAALKQKGFIQ